MTRDQREVFRLLLVELLQKAAEDQWPDDELVEVILDMEQYIDALIEEEVFTLLNTLENPRYDVN